MPSCAYVTKYIITLLRYYGLSTYRMLPCGCGVRREYSFFQYSTFPHDRLYDRVRISIIPLAKYNDTVIPSPPNSASHLALLWLLQPKVLELQLLLPRD